jgi:hypothetical protein
MSSTDALEWYSMGDFVLVTLILITKLVTTFCPITFIT